jgi:TetR/AcrR family tetracycline transcriptional repressor
VPGNQTRHERRTRRAAAGRLTPGPKPKLTQAQILDQALDLLADQGIEGLSLRRLAAVCGVTPMTLYGYFASKDALLDAIVTYVMPVPIPRPAEARNWSESLRDCLVGIQDAFLSKPGVAALLAGRSLSDPSMDELREYILGLLHDAGVPDGNRVTVLGVIIRYILGCAAIEGASWHHGHAAEQRRLKALPTDRFPELSAVAASYGDRASPAASRLGVDLLIFGIAGFAVQNRKV